MTVEKKLQIRLQTRIVFHHLIGYAEQDGWRIFLKIPDFAFGRIVDIATKPKKHCTQQATKALTVNELRYPMKKVAFPVHYLREFG